MLRPGLRQNLKALRSSFFELCKFALNEARYGRELRRYCKDRNGLLLNIGCGQLTPDGWVNADRQPIPGRSFYLDVRNGLPLSNGSARHIHCEHFLEHLEFSEAERFLCDRARVLEHAGTMRLIVPDLKKYVTAYAKNDNSFFEGLRFLGGAVEPLETKAAVCNQMLRMGGNHKFACSKPYSMRLAVAVSRMLLAPCWGAFRPTWTLMGRMNGGHSKAEWRRSRVPT